MAPTIAHACEHIKNKPINNQLFKSGHELWYDDYNIQIKLKISNK